MDKRTYTILGGSTSVIALVINQVLWLVTNLRFGPGILIGVFAPLFIGGVGVSAGVKAMTRYGPRFGVTLITVNVVGAVLGLWWALVFQPRVFGPDPMPVYLASL